uniref:Uncharacterized protein n=1 Tax=Anguilla anguilla TaxID=7936 RepID=A0A0E9UA13_ANGAN
MSHHTAKLNSRSHLQQVVV